jgi:hypothetical protein
MKPRVLAAFLVLAALGAGAEAASLPKAFSPAERARVAAVRQALPRHQTKPARWSEQRRHRYLQPTHVARLPH